MSNLAKEFRELLAQDSIGGVCFAELAEILDAKLPLLLDQLDDQLTEIRSFQASKIKNALVKEELRAELKEAKDYIEDLKHNYDDAKRFFIKMNRYRKALEKCKEQRNNAIEKYLETCAKKPSHFDVVGRAVEGVISFKDKETNQILKGDPML